MGGDRQTRTDRWLEQLPLAPARLWVAPAVSLVILAVALVIRLAIWSVAPNGLAFVTFFPAVLLIAFLFGMRMGAVSAILSVILAWGFLLADPLGHGLVLTAVPAFIPFAVLVSFNLWLFHQMQRTNAKLRRERERTAALAETRETLFRELQHRVSNNIQVAAGLLSLQKRHVGDAAGRDALDEASRRLAVIGRVSRELYASDGMARPMRDVLAPLCANVVEVSGRTGISVMLEGRADVLLPPDAAVPLALIVAEAVANAIEHGLAARETGVIQVAFARQPDGTLRIAVEDDGGTLPDGFDPAASNSLGLGIVRALASQLGGSFTLTGGARTKAQLIVPA